MFALVDCNNFYASCERVFNPNLLGKPIVILSNNDGCVIARSNEAKALGIPMGAPAFQFEKDFEQKGINVFSSNYALYGNMSKRVMMVLSEFTPEIEIYSVDECFLGFKGFEKYDLTDYGHQIHRRVKKATGIPVSVGFAPTKALAKVANKIAKKFSDRTGNSYVIDTPEKLEKALRWTKIEDVWGIGRRNTLKLVSTFKIRNAWEFTQLGDAWIRKNMSVVGLKLKYDLLGVSTINWEEIKPKQNIATTRSFKGMISEIGELKERVSTFADTCAVKLRNEGSHCNSIEIFLLSNQHRTDLQQYNRCIKVKCPFPTNSTLELNKLALNALSIIFRDGILYKKAGVIVGDITPEESYQTNLFRNEDTRHKNLMQAIDRINKKLGIRKIRLGSQDLQRTWKMKQERLSPNYTTRWNDLITVICAEETIMKNNK